MHLWIMFTKSTLISFDYLNDQILSTQNEILCFSTFISTVMKTKSFHAGSNFPLSLNHNNAAIFFFSRALAHIFLRIKMQTKNLNNNKNIRICMEFFIYHVLNNRCIYWLFALEKKAILNRVIPKVSDTVSLGTF